jgi:hypothetical protein
MQMQNETFFRLFSENRGKNRFVDGIDSDGRFLDRPPIQTNHK